MKLIFDNGYISLNEDAVKLQKRDEFIASHKHLSSTLSVEESVFVEKIGEFYDEINPPKVKKDKK